MNEQEERAEKLTHTWMGTWFLKGQQSLQMSGEEVGLFINGVSVILHKGKERIGPLPYTTHKSQSQVD